MHVYLVIRQGDTLSDRSAGIYTKKAEAERFIELMAARGLVYEMHTFLLEDA